MDRKREIDHASKLDSSKKQKRSPNVLEFPTQTRNRTRRSAFLELLERGSQQP